MLFFFLQSKGQRRRALTRRSHTGAGRLLSSLIPSSACFLPLIRERKNPRDFLHGEVSSRALGARRQAGADPQLRAAPPAGQKPPPEGVGATFATKIDRALRRHRQDR